ncbi:unnamed protein product, partial [marine sediment metagenome]
MISALQFAGRAIGRGLSTVIAIPKLDKPYLIWNEIGYVTIRDNGVLAVPADPLGVTVALTGIRIEMR